MMHPKESWETCLKELTNLLPCKSYIVVDNMSFYKIPIVTYSLFLVITPYVNSMGGYIPWVIEYHGLMNTMGDAIYNTMGIFHEWINIMGR